MRTSGWARRISSSLWSDSSRSVRVSRGFGTATNAPSTTVGTQSTTWRRTISPCGSTTRPAIARTRADGGEKSTGARTRRKPCTRATLQRNAAAWKGARSTAPGPRPLPEAVPHRDRAAVQELARRHRLPARRLQPRHAQHAGCARDVDAVLPRGEHEPGHGTRGRLPALDDGRAVEQEGHGLAPARRQPARRGAGPRRHRADVVFHTNGVAVERDHAVLLSETRHVRRAGVVLGDGDDL